jgi:antitoxin MazE
MHQIYIELFNYVNRSKEGIMIVAPAKRIRGRHNLTDLVAHIPESYQSGEVDWGEPVGKEAW